MRMLLPAIILLFTVALTASAKSAPGAELTVAQWREDLDFLAGQIQKVHPHPFHHVSQAQFLTAVSALEGDIPTLSNHEVEVRLAQLVAMLGEGHSRLSFAGLPDPMSDVDEITPYKVSGLAFHRLPLQFYLFSDGLFVIGATTEYRQFIGAQVLKIGSETAQSALNSVEPVINRDNDMGARLIGPDIVAIPEVLSAFHVVSNEFHVPLTIRGLDGTARTIDMQPLAAGTSKVWIYGSDAMHRTNSPYVAHTNENLWVEYRADSETLFAHINVIQDSPGLSVAQFAGRIEALAASHIVKRFVLDFRDCHGGDNQKFRGLLLSILRDKSLDQPGRLFVLINRATFSAAVNAVSDLERLSNAIFVGEPTAGAPSAWGDPQKITLPNSGLIARISSVYWRDWTANESRPWIAPDIATAASSSTYFAGQDLDMNAVLAFPQPTNFASILANVVRGSATSVTVLRLYYQHKTDVALANEASESAMQAAGSAFLARKSYKDAFLMFAINFKDYPHSLPDAISSVDAALSSDPNNEDLKSLAGKLRALANHS